MSQTLSRMERLARAEDERKRFRQAATSSESSTQQQEPVPVPESASLHQPALATPDLETQMFNQTSVSSPDAIPPQSSNFPEQTIATEATVAGNATVAQEATVTPDTLVEIRGYGPFTWDLLDGIMPRLDPYEQVVLLRLCRLAWGYKKDTCRVGYDRLQQACNLKKRKLQEVISKLEFLRYIRRLALEQGGPDRSLRGTEYQILLTPPLGCYAPQ